jgi:hypothetical protein
VPSDHAAESSCCSRPRPASDPITPFGAGAPRRATRWIRTKTHC